MSIDFATLNSLCGSTYGVLAPPVTQARNNLGLPVSIYVTGNKNNKNLGASYNFEGVGTSFNPQVAYAKSILEAAERYCQTFKPAASDILTGTAVDLEKKYQVIATDKFNLHDDTVYDRYPQLFQRPDRKMPAEWVDVKSSLSGDSYLVPADLIYFNPSEKKSLCIQTSNGTALFSSLPEAIEKAAFEMIERDLLMTYWKQELRPMPIDARSVFQKIGVDDRVNCLSFYEDIRFFWYPLPFDLFAVSCGIFGSSPSQPAFVLGGSTDKTLEKALLKSLEEALQIYSLSSGLMRKKRSLKVDEVKSFPDHAEFYANYDNFKTHVKIFDPQMTGISCDEVQTVVKKNQVGTGIQEYISSLDQDLLYRDLTTRDIQKAGFHVVRVLSPGMLNLDMNHNQRFDQIPENKKYWSFANGKFSLRAFQANSLNPSPHPFA